MPLDQSWRNTPPEVTHCGEFLVESILNRYLAPHNLKSFRVPKNPYSAWDLDIYNFDMATLTQKEKIIRIDVERKKLRFPEGKPPSPIGVWPYGVRFLKRKDKASSRNIDVYMLFDNSDTDPRFIWTTYGFIREKGLLSIGLTPDTSYFRIRPQFYTLLQYNLVSLTEYICGIRDANF
ncbi:MAG TPA: hypothetical protein VMY59_02120 [Candidatus Thermoplasmatota archaeon]|nr:hypothetical protein [Candidatus Thermoplasmatota archaeon]